MSQIKKNLKTPEEVELFLQCMQRLQIIDSGTPELAEIVSYRDAMLQAQAILKKQERVQGGGPGGKYHYTGRFKWKKWSTYH